MYLPYIFKVRQLIIFSLLISALVYSAPTHANVKIAKGVPIFGPWDYAAQFGRLPGERISDNIPKMSQSAVILYAFFLKHLSYNKAPLGLEMIVKRTPIVALPFEQWNIAPFEVDAIKAFQLGFESLVRNDASQSAVSHICGNFKRPVDLEISRGAKARIIVDALKVAQTAPNLSVESKIVLADAETYFLRFAKGFRLFTVNGDLAPPSIASDLKRIQIELKKASVKRIPNLNSCSGTISQL
jgi:hypothetical protein